MFSDPEDPVPIKRCKRMSCKGLGGAGRRVVALPEAAVPSRQRTPPDEDMHREH